MQILIVNCCAADAKLGSFGFGNKYGDKYYDADDPNAFKIDVILFAADDDCITALHRYAEIKFHALNDTYRRHIARLTDWYKNQYSRIVANSDVVSKQNLTLPEDITVPHEPTGKKYENHLYADKETGLLGSSSMVGRCLD